MEKNIKNRLEYLREQIKAENISYGEIAELQGLAKYIEKGDVELLEWAGVKEKQGTKHSGITTPRSKWGVKQGNWQKVLPGDRV